MKLQGIVTLAAATSLFAASSFANSTNTETRAGKLCFMNVCLVTIDNGTGWKPGRPIKDGVGDGKLTENRGGLKSVERPPLMTINNGGGWKPGQPTKE